MKVVLKKVLKNFLIYLLLFIILISSYMILMTLSSLIPSSWIENHVRESSETLFEEGERNVYDLKYKKARIFTFTDALMINTAYSIDSSSPMQSFIFARKNYIPGQTKYIYPDSQYNLGANEKYIDKKTGDLHQTKELYALMHGEKIEDSYEYARYWHGYLVVLRPLLLLFNYESIRVFLFIISLILIGAICYLLYKKIDLMTAIIFLIGLLSVDILVVTQSINEILIFLVAFISIIILLLRKDIKKNIGAFFFIVGSVSSFIDLLTAPVVTLGLAAITYFLLLQKQEKANLKIYILELLKIGISWVLGYGLTWIAKWVITEVFFGRPMMSQVLTQASFRTNVPIVKGKDMFNRWQIISINIKELSKPTIIANTVIVIVYALILVICNYKNCNIKNNIIKCIPYVATLFFPIIWFMVIKQHSYTHVFFVYRTLSISIISLLLIIKKLFERNKKEEENINNEKNAN